MRYLLFGMGAGLGLGIWSTLSIFFWERHFNRVPKTSGEGAPTPTAMTAEPTRSEATSPETNAEPPGTRPPASAAGSGGVPPELRNAPQQWISENIDAQAGPHYVARLSLAPPGLRVEECNTAAGSEPCRISIAGNVVALTADTVTVRSSQLGNVTLGWKISGERMTLVFQGRELRFRPGTKEELLQLLSAGSGGGR